MPTIREQLSAQQQAELVERAAQTVPPELDYGQLAEPEAVTSAPETASPVQDAPQPAPGQEAAITVNAAARRLPWQTKERRVATSTQGAPKHVETVQAPQKKAPKARKTVQAKEDATGEARSETPKRARTAAKKAAETAQPEQPAKTVAKKTAANKAVKKAAAKKTTAPKSQGDTQPAEPLKRQLTATEKAERRWGGTVKLGDEGSLYDQLAPTPEPTTEKIARTTTRKTDEAVLSRSSQPVRPKSRVSKEEWDKRAAAATRTVRPKAYYDESGIFVDPERIANAQRFVAGAPLRTTVEAPTYATHGAVRPNVGGQGPAYYELVPLIPLRPADVSARVQNRMTDALESLKRFAGFGKEKSTQENTRRRLLVAAGVAGAVAVGLVIDGILQSRGYGSLRTHSGMNGIVRHDQLPHIAKQPANPNSTILAELAAHGHAGGPGVGHELLNLNVRRGDMPWNVLHNAGVPDHEILARLNDAAKESGLPYHWHGSGEHRWLEVDGKSGTKAVIKMLSPYLKK